MKLIEKIFYYAGCLAYGFAYIVKVSVKKAIEEIYSAGTVKEEPKSIYEEETQTTTQPITEDTLKDIECINCHEKSLRIEKVKCKKCGFEGKLPSLYRYDK